MEFIAVASLGTISILVMHSFLTHLCFCENPACINLGHRLRLEQEWPKGRKPADLIERKLISQDHQAIRAEMCCGVAMKRYFPEPCPIDACGHSWRFCVRLKGHEGDHIAASDHPYRPILARWKQGFTLRPFDTKTSNQ